MPTLSEWAKAETDLVLKGIFINILTANELMAHLQFQTFEGNSLKYNRENALPTASTYQVGSTWADTEPTFTAKSVSLTTLGVQSPMDRYVLQTRGSVQDPLAILKSSMAKALARKIEQQIIVGDSGTNSNDMEGILSLLIADTRVMMMDNATLLSTVAGAETELTLDRLDQMIDLVENGLPNVLVMNKTMRRKLTSLCRVSAASGIMTNSMDDFGRQVFIYNTIPIVICDWLTNSETYENASGWPTSTATTILALKFGQENQGYTIIHNGNVMTPDWQHLGIKHDKNEDLYRMVVYANACLYSAKSCACLAGIDSAA